MMLSRRSCGFTMVEILIVIFILIISVTAILSAEMAQLTLSEHARNLSLAINDVNRVIEGLRQQNSPCTGLAPSAVPPGVNRTSWDAWLADLAGGGGKSLPPNSNEIVMVTCQSTTGTPPAYCPQAQVGNAGVSTEWHYAVSPSSGPSENPMRITVAVCWSHRGRIIGECLWSAGNVPPLLPNDTGDRVITSPALATTLVTCRAP